MDLNSETQLVEAAQGGHLESFGVLYQRYHSSMVALAYSMLADRDLAEGRCAGNICDSLSRHREFEKHGTICGMVGWHLPQYFEADAENRQEQGSCSGQ